jgi:HK97 gp10 family phage protein
MTLILNQIEIDHMLRGSGGIVDAEILKLALAVELEAKRLAPVDTGRLRASVTHQMGVDATGPVGFVGSPVEYAIYQEMGTRFQSGTPFLRPALQSVKL